MTTGKVHEQAVAHTVSFEKNDVVVFDRGYSDFSWYATLDSKGVSFVTRAKCNLAYRTVEKRDVRHLPNILADHVIQLKNFYAKQDYPKQLRRIISKDPATSKKITILTNQLSWSARTIAAVYKERWQIELFFKALKQQLKVKSFVGTSKNALLSQLWNALIAYLLLSYLKFRSKFNWSLYTLASILPTNLFSRRNLWDWLNAPFQATSPTPSTNVQHYLVFS